MNRTWKRPNPFVLALLLSGLTTGGIALSQQGGKGKPPAPPPIRYQITWLYPLAGDITANARDINNAGVVVGVSGDRAFAYAPGWSGVQDLNVLAPAPAGRVLWTANSVNESWQIVGTATSTVDGERRAYLYDPNRNPTVTILPQFGTTKDNAGRSINDSGDVVGDFNSYSSVFWYSSSTGSTQQWVIPGFDPRVNNLGHIVTQNGYRYTPQNGTWEFFNGLEPRGLNHAGTFTGRKLGSTYLKDSVFRYSSTRGLEVLYESSATDIGADINESEDVVFRGKNNRGFVYMNEHRGD